MALSSDIRYIVGSANAPNEIHSMAYESSIEACAAAKKHAQAGAGPRVVFKVVPIALFRAVTEIVEEKP